MSAQRGPTVFLVDDDQAVRESLRWLIESVGLNVATYDSAQAFLENYYPGRAGCLVLDLRMPGMSGLELQEKLVAQGSQLPIIIITGHGDVPMAVRAMKAGAVDFVQKPFHDQELLDRIHEALEQNARTRQAMAERTKITARLAHLTPRELEVMDGVVAGKSNKVIAAELGISGKTVEVHRAKIMEKMQAKSLAELVQLTLLAREYMGQH